MPQIRSHYLADLLAPWGDVVIKRMFGGLGAWRDGVFFGLIDGDDIYFKVDDAHHAEYAAAGSKPFAYSRTRDGVAKLNIINKWWLVPGDVLEDSERLTAWAQRAYDTARLKPEKPKKAGKSTSGADFQALGAALTSRLRAIGITSEAQLQHAGAIAAYKKLKSQYPETKPTVLWALYAAVNRLDIADVTPDIKEHLISLMNITP